MKKVLMLVAAAALVTACGDKKSAGATDDDGAPVAAPSSSAPVVADQAPMSATAPQAPAAAGGDDSTTLDASDEKLATGQYYDAYPLPVQGDETIYIDLKAAFKPVLIVLDPNQKKLSESTALSQNSDGSWGISFSDEFKEPGSYYVVIAAEKVGDTGAYSTELRRGRKIG